VSETLAVKGNPAKAKPRASLLQGEASEGAGQPAAAGREQTLRTGRESTAQTALPWAWRIWSGEQAPLPWRKMAHMLTAPVLLCG